MKMPSRHQHVIAVIKQELCAESLTFSVFAYFQATYSAEAELPLVDIMYKVTNNEATEQTQFLFCNTTRMQLFPISSTLHVM